MNTVFTIEPVSKPQIDIKVGNLSYTINEPNATGIKLPFKPRVPKDGSAKVVLDDITFNVKCGQIMGIMGSSGSGKTSLLNVLACKQVGGQVTGDIELNGVKYTKNMIETFSAYVRQDDRLLAHLTVKESLMFVGQLKLPTYLTKTEIERKVDAVIMELGLNHVAHTRVGGADLRGISGGERRRVSIGIQLLMDPSILILDEPTSGLDSFTAHNLIQTLANLAKNQRTVLLSIHQPRSDIFELFDMILVLSLGKTVYFGETNNMVDYFTNLGFPCPELTNPSDFYIDLVTVDVTSEETEKTTMDVFHQLVQAYKTSSLPCRNSLLNTSHSQQENILVGATTNNKDHPGFITQFQVLTRRHFRNTVIDQWTLILQTVVVTLMSLILGTVFYDLGTDQRGLRDRFGYLFMINMMYPYNNSLEVIGQSHLERKFVYFELEDKLYGHLAYFLAKVTAELPMTFIFSSLYFIPSYFMTNLKQDAESFFTVYGIVILLIICSKSWALCAATTFPNYTISSTVSNTLLALYCVCSGYFFNLDSMLEETRWVADISPIRWAFDSMSIVEYKNVTFSCGSLDPRFCVQTGEEALALYGFSGDVVWKALVIMVGNIFSFQLLAFLSFRFIQQKPYEF